MMAGPRAPGAGESWYQPGFASGSSSDGTSTVPSGLRPSSTSALSTPMAGTESETGTDAGSVGSPVGPVEVGPVDSVGSGIADIDGVIAGELAVAGDELAPVGDAVAAVSPARPDPQAASMTADVPTASRRTPSSRMPNRALGQRVPFTSMVRTGRSAARGPAPPGHAHDCADGQHPRQADAQLEGDPGGR